MYNLPYYKEKNVEVVLDFMKQHPFAMLIGAHAQQQPVATQVPVLLKEKDGQLFLQGHIMKQTDHHMAFETNSHALVVFTGPHAYVSASWYHNPQQASTWNYMAVHAKGTLRFLDDVQLQLILDELTSYFEHNPSSPSLYKELSPDYITRLSKAIIAFEIAITDIEHVFKLSQNRDQQSFENIVYKLQHGDAASNEVAAEMLKRKNQLFGS